MQTNAHAFRTSQISAAYQAGSGQSSLQTLADSMGHSIQTAQTHYRVTLYRQQSTLSSVLLQNLYRKAAQEGQEQPMQQQPIQQQPIQQPAQQQHRLSSSKQLFISSNQPRWSAIVRTTATAQSKAVILQPVTIESENIYDVDDTSDDDIIDLTSERLQPAQQDRRDVFQRAVAINTPPQRGHGWK